MYTRRASGSFKLPLVDLMANVSGSDFGSAVAEPAEMGSDRTSTADLRASTGSVVSRLPFFGAAGISPLKKEFPKEKIFPSRPTCYMSEFVS